jgi:hypothetical protein
LIGVIAGVIACSIKIFEHSAENPKIDMSGAWIIIETVEQTQHEPFQGMKLGYRVFFTQSGKNIAGDGEKWWENGREVRGAAHTPITFKGVIKGNAIHATYVEQGTKRQSSGEFDWTMAEDSNCFKGTFSSSAANARGNSVMIRANDNLKYAEYVVVSR